MVNAACYQLGFWWHICSIIKLTIEGKLPHCSNNLATTQALQIFRGYPLYQSDNFWLYSYTPEDSAVKTSYQLASGSSRGGLKKIKNSYQFRLHSDLILEC